MSTCHSSFCEFQVSQQTFAKLLPLIDWCGVCLFVCNHLENPLAQLSRTHRLFTHTHTHTLHTLMSEQCLHFSVAFSTLTSQCLSNILIAVFICCGLFHVEFSCLDSCLLNSLGHVQIELLQLVRGGLSSVGGAQDVPGSFLHPPPRTRPRIRRHGHTHTPLITRPQLSAPLPPQTPQPTV